MARGAARRGFTLIELLLVVAIISILAAIAVPNFLEASNRSKVSRARSDLRTLTTALESYYMDCNAYPQAEINGTLKYFPQLSTPVAYLADSVLPDPFTPDKYVSIARIPTYRYYGFNEGGVLNTYRETRLLYSDHGDDARIRWYMLFCHGPDGVRNNLDLGAASGTFVKNAVITDPDIFVHYIYDPTNGALSPGELFRPGGAPVGATAASARLASSG